MDLYIMAAGKSSRFSYEPKILKTFEYNEKIFKKFFDNIYIVSTDDLLNKYPKIKTFSKAITGDFGNGSGSDVFELKRKIKKPICVCWSDVFFNEQNIKDILDAYKKYNKNCLTATKRKNPYVSLIFEQNKLIGWTKGQNEGYQDNSIFIIKELKEKNKEFLDLAVRNDFYVEIVKEKTLFFNTSEEYEKVLKELK